jgi:hypothetical protein
MVAADMFAADVFNAPDMSKMVAAVATDECGTGWQTANRVQGNTVV